MTAPEEDTALDWTDVAFVDRAWNVSVNETSEPRRIMYPRAATVFAAACCILFVVVGTAGNALTAMALGRCAKLRRNATTAFVISLSVADLLFCSFNLPLTASRYISQKWMWGDALCVLFPFLFYGNVGVSLVSMTAITINRYILIAHNKWYDAIYQRRRNVLLMIAFVWIFSFSLLIPPLAKVWGQFGYHHETFSCTIRRLHGSSPKKFLFLFGFLLPCVAIVLSYSCIFYEVRRSRHNVAAHGTKVANGGKGHQAVHGPCSSQWTEDLRLTRLMLVIFCTFLLCYLPLMIANVFDDDYAYPALHVVASVCAYASACINPFLYAVLNRQYRQAYVRLLRCGRRTAAQHTHSGSGSGHSRSSSGKTQATDVYRYSVVADRLQPLRVQNGDVEGDVPVRP